MTDVRVTVLVENTAGGRGLLGEHGLSLRIELPGGEVLFDTGQGTALRRNARRLGARLDRTRAVLLSHGHYDHVGGLRDVLIHARSTTVYAHPDAFRPKYVRNSDGTARKAGTDPADEQTVQESADLVRVEGPMEIRDGLRLTGPVPRTTDFEDTGGAFYLDEACTRPDELLDDQAAFLETPSGTVVFLGCAHAGVINTLRYVRALTNGRPIHTVLGGMHLQRADAHRMERTVEELRRMDVQRLLPCHCTGFAAAARLWNELPGRCAACPAGTFVEMEA